MFTFDLNCAYEVADYSNLERRTVSFKNFDNDSDIYISFFLCNLQHLQLA